MCRTDTPSPEQYALLQHCSIQHGLFSVETTNLLLQLKSSDPAADLLPGVAIDHALQLLAPLVLQLDIYIYPIAFL